MPATAVSGSPAPGNLTVRFSTRSTSSPLARPTSSRAAAARSSCATRLRRRPWLAWPETSCVSSSPASTKVMPATMIAMQGASDAAGLV